LREVQEAAGAIGLQIQTVSASTTGEINAAFTTLVDVPVELGLVASLNRPGGNVTGMSTVGSGLHAKSVQLLKELVPTPTVIVYLINPSNQAAAYYAKDALNAASTLNTEIKILKASTEHDLDETSSMRLRSAPEAMARSAFHIYEKNGGTLIKR
jgi:putative tryptophan/tyrosine transport system substrate-binding protein